MTRVVVYSGALVLFVAATAATLYSIFADNWLVWHAESNRGDHFTKKIGLHHSWTSTSGRWETYPSKEDCDAKTMGGHFCSMWRTTAFMMSFAAVLELATLVAYLVIIIGGRQKRENGWKLLVSMLAVIGVAQCFCMSTVSYLYDYDHQFSVPGWQMDWGFTWCTFSWVVSISLAVGISLSAYFLPSEGGYELIPSERSEY